MTIIGIRNRNVARVPKARRRWLTVGDVVQVAPTQALEVSSECDADGGPRFLLLVWHSALGRFEIRQPEDLGWHTTEILVRAVEYSSRGIERVLIDQGELVTAPAMCRALQ